jgi:hypothetical protein
MKNLAFLKTILTYRTLRGCKGLLSNYTTKSGDYFLVCYCRGAGRPGNSPRLASRKGCGVVTKYGFLTFPTYGQMNPTLVTVQELVSRGDEVVYFQTEGFRRAIEATGARLHAGDTPVPRRESGGSCPSKIPRLPILLPCYLEDYVVGWEPRFGRQDSNVSSSRT